MSERFGLLPSRSMRIDDQRVLVAVFDSPPKVLDTIWTKYEDKGRELGLVLVKEGNNDEGTLRVRVLDVDASDRKVRWWKVNSMARAENMQTIPISWDGPASDVPEKYKVMDPNKPHRTVLVRLADAGPWAKIELEPAPPAEARGM